MLIGTMRSAGKRIHECLMCRDDILTASGVATMDDGTRRSPFVPTPPPCTAVIVWCSDGMA